MGADLHVMEPGVCVAGVGSGSKIFPTRFPLPFCFPVFKKELVAHR